MNIYKLPYSDNYLKKKCDNCNNDSNFGKYLNNDSSWLCFSCCNNNDLISDTQTNICSFCANSINIGELFLLKNNKPIHISCKMRYERAIFIMQQDNLDNFIVPFDKLSSQIANNDNINGTTRCSCCTKFMYNHEVNNFHSESNSYFCNLCLQDIIFHHENSTWSLDNIINLKHTGDISEYSNDYNNSNNSYNHYYENENNNLELSGKPPPELDINSLCVICQISKPNIVLDPCGHLCLCFSCAKNKNMDIKCPICRTDIEKKIKVYAC